MADYEYSVRVDAPRNVLYLAQSGFAERGDLERFRDAYRAALRELRPGFAMIHDQRDVRGFSDEALEVGKELVEMTNEAAPAVVIRIVAGGIATRSRVTRVLVAGRSRYRNMMVTSPEEAERTLTELRGAG